ncbi:MAG: hypothetical protein ABUT11_00890 [Leifsonia sp.]
MSGTDELFPDAEQHPGALVPPVPPSPPAVAPAAAPLATPARRRGIGAAAFVLGLLAILGDLIGVVVALFTLLGAVTDLRGTFTNIDGSLGAVLGVIILEFIVFFGGILFALLAVILGIVAAARNRGRVLGVFGVVFGVGVLAVHVMILITVTTSNNLPGLSS